MSVSKHFIISIVRFFKAVSLAFIQLTKLNKVSPKISLTLVSSLANAAGPEGMVKGQAIDINSVNRFLTLEELELMHHKKTGALILASIIMGALSTGKATIPTFPPMVLILKQFSHVCCNRIKAIP